MLLLLMGSAAVKSANYAMNLNETANSPEADTPTHPHVYQKMNPQIPPRMYVRESERGR